MSEPEPRILETVPILNESGLQVFTMPWQVKPPQDVLVVGVKGTFDLVVDGPATLADDQRPPTGDVRYDDEAKSLRYTSDFAVFKPKADILLVGHAYPGDDPTVDRVVLRLGAWERTLAVFGDRRWNTLGGQTRAAPFNEIPLRWERALGGGASKRNPVGRGYKTGLLLPNLEQVDALVRSAHDDRAPACCAPVDATWAQRASKLGRYDATWLRHRWPYFPDSFDRSYFNAAPPEQQVEYPQGDEEFLLGGVHPVHTWIRGRLPRMRPRGLVKRVTGDSNQVHDLVLRLDTVWFDTDAMKLVLVWRGMLDTCDEGASDIASLLFMREDHGSPIDLDSARARLLASEGVEPTDEPANEPAGAGGVVPPVPAISRQEIESRLHDGIPLADCDLTDADLSGLDLRKVNLERAILKGANLQGSQMDHAMLAGANLAFARLENATLIGVDLSRADLHGANLEGASFAEANLVEAELSKTRSVGCDFAGVTATRAIFVQASLDRAQFDKADLTHADLTGCALDGVSFAHAKLDDAKLYEAEGEGTRFDDASLTDCRADRASFRGAAFLRVSAKGSMWQGARLVACTLLEADLQEANLAASDLHESDLSKADLRKASFRGANLRSARFLRSNLMEATLESAILKWADMRGANLYQTETWKAVLDGADLDLALTAGSKLSK